MLQLPIRQVLMQPLQLILPSGLSFPKIWLKIMPILFQYVVYNVESFADHLDSNFYHFVLVFIQLKIRMVCQLAFNEGLGFIRLQNVQVRGVKQVSLRNIAPIVAHLSILLLIRLRLVIN